MAVGVVAVEQALGVGVQELHREVDALEIAALDGQSRAAWWRRRTGRWRRTPAQLLGRIILADLAAGDEGDALGRHQIDAPLDEALVELHVGDAVHEQAADAVGALEDGDPVAGPVELGGGSQPGGAGADDGDLLAGAHGRRLGDDPAFLEALVDDGALDGLDRHRPAR